MRRHKAHGRFLLLQKSNADEMRTPKQCTNNYFSWSPSYRSVVIEDKWRFVKSIRHLKRSEINVGWRCATFKKMIQIVSQLTGQSSFVWCKICVTTLVEKIAENLPIHDAHYRKKTFLQVFIQTEMTITQQIADRLKSDSCNGVRQAYVRVSTMIRFLQLFTLIVSVITWSY